MILLPIIILFIKLPGIKIFYNRWRNTFNLYIYNKQIECIILVIIFICFGIDSIIILYMFLICFIYNILYLYMNKGKKIIYVEILYLVIVILFFMVYNKEY